MEFVEYFLRNTDHPMWVSSIDNAAGKGAVEKKVLSRDEEKLSSYATKMDLKGHSIYYCASTILAGKRRKKEHALEVFFLWADLDFREIDLPPDEILERLKSLGCPPTRIHATGGGYHALWQLRQRVDLTVDGEIDRVESALKLLALNVAGDPMVCQVVSLLRLPGSHNPKRERKPLVSVLKSDGPTYHLRELTEWLGSLSAPAMLRRGEDDNPYLRASAAQGFKPPIDVEDRLASMVHHGVGDSSIHSTQVSVTASLMAQGVDEDEAVRMVLEATQAVGPPSWDWKREERKIRVLCQSFLRKHPELREEQPFPRLAIDNGRSPKRDSDGDDGGDVEEVHEGNVVALAEHRQKKTKKAKGDAHVALGKGVLLKLKSDNQRMLFSQGRMFLYKNGVWRGYTSDEEKVWISVEVEKACRGIDLTSTSKLVNETKLWLQRNPDLHDDTIEWDAHGKIPTSSGLIDPTTWRVEEYAPEHYATMRIDCRYDPSARCPVWTSMLEDAFEGDAETIQFVKELVGTSLVAKKPRSLTRVLVLLGASNSGKSNLINVMAGLVSNGVNSTPLATLENAHGLVNFLSPHPWVLHEAFEQAKWEMSATTKALLSGDPVTVNVKNGALISHRWRGAAFWGTNVPPQFKEASRAMENRLAIVNVKRVYDHTQVVGAAALARDRGYSSPAELVLTTEKEGVLAWAIDGLRSAMARGYFKMTDEMAESLHAMRMASNIASGFMEECCEFTHTEMVSTPDFYAAFSAWWRENKGGIIPTVDSLGRAMSSLSDPRIAIGLKHNHVRHYAGIKLTGSGLDYWNAHAQSAFSERSGLRISSSADEVNKEIPGAWDRHEQVVRLRRT